MAYGVQIFGAAGNTLLDTNAQTQMQVPGSVTSASSFTKQTGEIVLASKSSSGHTAMNQSFGSNTISAGSTLNWITVRQVDEDTPPTQGAYGITLFDAGGNSTKTYSDSYTKSFTIIAIYPAGTLLGNTDCWTGSTTDIYVGGGKPYYSFSQSGGAAWNNFYYYSNRIQFINYFTASFLGTLQAYNSSPVIVAKLRN